MDSAPEPNAQTVLVTGGSGFLGSWMTVELLRRGYTVRSTIRTLAREPEVRATISTQVDASDRLSYFAADLLGDAGWDHAVDGSDFVMHVASPMPVGEYKGQDLIRPAREGTRRVLEAANKAGVKRVVMTSSSSAAAPPRGSTGVSDETTWTDLPDKPAFQYPRSKTLAEQDAWAFVAAGGLELATVLPSSILGPVLASDSVDIVGYMLHGKMPVLPRAGFSFVDVRDLVDLHILAMTTPAAAGQRFLGAGEFLWFHEVAQILRDHFGAAASKVPTRRIPDFVVRIGALIDKDMAFMAPNLGVRSNLSAAKAHQLLGWTPRPVLDSIVDTATSHITRGTV
jgi:dihydroflavonol-4-reductase